MLRLIARPVLLDSAGLRRSADLTLGLLPVVELRLEEARAVAAPVPLRAAALDHEAGDRAVEDGPVVEAVAGELDEVRDVLGGLVVEELDDHLSG